VLSISLFYDFFLQRSLLSIETSSPIFTTNTSGKENSHCVIHSRNQQQFNMNVCAGIVGDCLIGPYVLPHRLTDNHYRDFLLHDLPKLLPDVPLAVRTRMWYLHDVFFFFLICIVGGGIKVHSTLRPLNGPLCQPRVIMIMEKSVE
jgi:hypothetical protein